LRYWFEQLFRKLEETETCKQAKVNSVMMEILLTGMDVVVLVL
jgi:hypothetical protein